MDKFFKFWKKWKYKINSEPNSVFWKSDKVRSVEKLFRTTFTFNLSRKSEITNSYSTKIECRYFVFNLLVIKHNVL